MVTSNQIHALAHLPPEKDPWYPQNRMLGGPQIQSGHFGEVSYACRESNPTSFIPVTIMTMITQLLQDLLCKSKREKYFRI
jgi:hypothetical protein